jgi:riboflavin kinase/FMN adenylyltransferase
MHTFKAQVVSGKGRGKKLGFPTINLDPVNLKINYGVYLISAWIDNRAYKGLLHFGPKKTFNEGISAEAHLKDFDLEVCSKNVIINITKRIRDVKKFSNVEELKKQINKDIRRLGA